MQIGSETTNCRMRIDRCGQMINPDLYRAKSVTIL
jgi:hypothetical protein